MTIEEAKNIKLEDYLHSLGYNPVKRQGMNLWYKSPFREEADASFKVNTEINKWYDFGLGKGGNILTLASVLYCSESLPYILHQIEEQAPHICPVSFSFQKQSPTEPSFQRMEVKPLESPVLLSYLREGGLIRNLRKENVAKYISRTTVSITMQSGSLMCVEGMKYGTSISRGVLLPRTSVIFGIRTGRMKSVMSLKDLWIIFLS